jgi:hypothetical protein
MANSPPQIIKSTKWDSLVNMSRQVKSHSEKRNLSSGCQKSANTLPQTVEECSRFIYGDRSSTRQSRPQDGEVPEFHADWIETQISWGMMSDRARADLRNRPQVSKHKHI